MPDVVDSQDAAVPDAAVEAIRAAVLETLCALCEKKPSVAVVDPPSGNEAGMSAVIRHDGDIGFELVLGIPRDTAKPLSAAFTGVPIEYDCDLMVDLAGEMVNVIAGNVAARLHLGGMGTAISLPTVARTLRPGPPEVRGVPQTTMRIEAEFGAVLLTICPALAGGVDATDPTGDKP